MVRLCGKKRCVPDKGANEERSEGGEEVRARGVWLRCEGAGTAKGEGGEEGEEDTRPCRSKKDGGKEEREGEEGPGKGRGREEAGWTRKVKRSARRRRRAGDSSALWPVGL